jgi:hypothetical protein
MIEDTNAANSDGTQPDSDESSVWTKSSPQNGCLVLSIRPYMCTPQSLQA